MLTYSTLEDDSYEVALPRLQGASEALVACGGFSTRRRGLSSATWVVPETRDVLGPLVEYILKVEGDEVSRLLKAACRGTSYIWKRRRRRLMRDRRTKWWVPLFLLGLLASCIAPAQIVSGWVFGSVLDPSGLPVVGASIAIDSAQGTHLTAATGSDGTFFLHLPANGEYTVRVKAQGFAPVIRPMQL